MQENAKISPVVVRTNNINKELKRVADLNKVNISTLDFNILKVQTFSHIEGEDDGDDDWIEVDEESLKELERETTALLNPKFYIKQVAEIEIHTKDNGKCPDVTSTIGGTNKLSKIFLTIKKGSRLEYFEGFKEAFILNVTKKKLRSKVLVGMFDSIQEKSLQKLNATVRVREEYTFEKNIMFQISEGIVPIETQDDKIILHYEEKQENKDDKDRVDYSKRGFLISVVENELLIEYIKAKKGTPGRNCMGEYIAPKEPVVANEPAFSIDSTITKIETEDRIEYRAAKSGYVTFDGGVYRISNEVEVGAIDFKSTGSIETELDADVSLNVKEKDDLKDAIGNNIEVEVNHITVEGSVGAKAVVKANKASIHGQTHGSSKLYVDELDINVHKGYASGKNVTVTRLEGGTIEADYVKVTQAIGGKIRAKEIEIQILGSHVSMIASHKIEIVKTTGTENNFTINPIIGDANQKVLHKSEKQLHEAEQSIQDITTELEKVTAEIEANTKVNADLTKKLLHYKKNKVKMPSSFVKKYKEFQELLAKKEHYNEELKLRSERYGQLKEMHDSLQADIFQARIINHDFWRGYNEIAFELIDPVQTISYTPKENTKILCIGLKKREITEDEYEYYIDALECDDIQEKKAEEDTI